MFCSFDDKAKDDNALSIANAPNFALSCFQIFCRGYGLPDVMLALASIIEISLHTRDRKSTRLNSSHDQISYAVFCLKKKKLSYLTGMPLDTVPSWMLNGQVNVISSTP